MSLSFQSLFSRKNLNLVVGLLTVLLVLWIVMFAVPGLFVNLFDTGLGNLMLLAIVVLVGMYNGNAALGVALVFLILWRFSHMSAAAVADTFRVHKTHFSR